MARRPPPGGAGRRRAPRTPGDRAGGPRSPCRRVTLVTQPAPAAADSCDVLIRRSLPLLLLVLLFPAAAGAFVARPVNVSAPTLSGASAAAGAARVGDALTCSPGTWTGTGI